MKITIIPLMLLAGSVLLFSSSMPFPAQENAQSKEKKYLPKELKKIKFGMSMSDVLKRRPNAQLEGEESFRKVYLEKLDGPEITSIAYYFDSDGEMPLYEIIVIYKSEALVKKESAKLLGPTNYKGGEWKKDVKADFPMHAWIFKNKLVYAMPLPGTEWEGDQL